MLQEMGQSRVNRIAYSDGLLEIMTPRAPHESSNRIIEGFVLTLCEEFGFEVKSTGSTTLTRFGLGKRRGARQQLLHSKRTSGQR